MSFAQTTINQPGTNTVSVAELNLSDGTSGQAIVTDGNGTISFASVGIDGIVSSANATAITIDSSENVGIETTNPSTKLTVRNDSDNVDNYILEIGNDLHATNTKDAWLKYVGGAATTDHSWTTGIISNTYRIVQLGARATAPSSGTERMRIDSSGDITMFGTGSLKVPSGTTAQRPSSPTVGMIRYNTSNSEVEGYIGSDWKSFAISFIASGGTETDATISGVTYRIHAFTSSGTFQVTAGSSNIDVLIVAGGGGGGGSTAGGGGAGGLIYQPAVGVLVGSYTITIGAGGAGSRISDLGSPNNTNGANTAAFGYTALGGGYGYSGRPTGSRVANSGGSGGGGGAYGGNDIATSSGAAGTSGQGYAGGAGNDPSNWGGGGGGGATAVGVDQTGTRAGGAGSDRSSIYGTTYGESGVFAGGGGGGAYNSGTTQGGTGGGGNGGDGTTGIPTAGSANTGGGGGGGGYYQAGGGGAGGSGIVIIRYRI
jgi:hypothetical protein